MSKHTPGPWVVNRYPEELLVEARPSGAFVAKCDGISATIGSAEELMTNARLIAAAPDMLAVLKDASFVIRAHAERYPGDRDAQALWDRCADAIYKAEGGGA